MTAVTRFQEATLESPSGRTEWMQWMPGERFAIRSSSEDTGGAYTSIDIMAEHGSGTPMHIHHNEDEHFIVLAGSMRMVLDGKTVDVSAGNTITVKKGVAHAWCNQLPAPLRFIVIFSPGGFEGCFRTLANRHEGVDLTPILDHYGCQIVGPPLMEQPGRSN